MGLIHITADKLRTDKQARYSNFTPYTFLWDSFKQKVYENESGSILDMNDL